MTVMTYDLTKKAIHKVIDCLYHCFSVAWVAVLAVCEKVTSFSEVCDFPLSMLSFSQQYFITIWHLSSASQHLHRHFRQIPRVTARAWTIVTTTQCSDLPQLNSFGTRCQKGTSFQLPRSLKLILILKLPLTSPAPWTALVGLDEV